MWFHRMRHDVLVYTVIVRSPLLASGRFPGRHDSRPLACFTRSRCRAPIGAIEATPIVPWKGSQEQWQTLLYRSPREIDFSSIRAEKKGKHPY